MRVLHVIDSGRSLLREFARPRAQEGFDDRVQACRTVLGLSSDLHEHRVCVMGTGRAVARSARLGLRADAVIAPLSGRPHLAPGAMGRLIRSIRPDVVHWWNASWTGGCFGRPGRAWHLESIAGTTPLKLPLWLSGGGAIVCGPAERANADLAGLTSFPIDGPVVVPAPRATPIEAGGATRLLLLGPEADARQFIFLCGLILGVEVRTSAIIPGTATTLARARRFRSGFPYHLDITTSHRPRADLLARCHVAVWMGAGGPRHPGPSAMAIRSALAAGVPVVVPPEAAWAIPESLRSSLVALNSTLGELARTLVVLLDHRTAVDRIGPGALVNADQANRSFVDAVLDAYEGRSTGSHGHPAPAWMRPPFEAAAATGA